MIKSKCIGAVTAIFMVAVVMLATVMTANPELFTSLTLQKEMPYVTQMDGTNILSIEISASQFDWDAMIESANEKEYIPANITINGVTVENVAIRPKGNSSLGAATRSESDRYSLKVEFDHYISGQTWLGLDKLCLNNMYSDNTYMKEYLSYDIMDYIGVATPQYAYADISVNGQPFGFYLAVEAIEESFAERNYGSDVGMLYKPESATGGMNMVKNGKPSPGGQGQMQGEPPPGGKVRGEPGQGGQIQNGQGQRASVQNGQTQDNQAQNGKRQGQGGQPPEGQMRIGSGLNGQEPEGQMQIGPGGNRGPGLMLDGGSSAVSALGYIDDDSSSYPSIFENSVFDATEADYQRVIAALQNLSAGTDLETYFDVDAILRYLAAHTVTVNLDSYISGMLHNYYLYEQNGRLTMLPWDYNEAFGGFSSPTASETVNFPIDTPVSKGINIADRPIIAKLLEVPEYLEKYHHYLKEIMDGYFHSGVFEQTFTSVSTAISEYVKADPNAFITFEKHQASIPVLKELIELRTQSIEGQLDGSIPSTWAGQNTDPTSLTNASAIQMSALGGGDGMMMIAIINGVSLNMQGMEITDRNILAQAVDIIRAAEKEELSEAQRAELHDLGLKNDQIEKIRQSILNPSTPPMKGGQPGNNMGGQPMGTSQNGREVPDTAENNNDSYIMLDVCVAALILGLIFVVTFKRRRAVC